MSHPNFVLAFEVKEGYSKGQILQEMHQLLVSTIVDSVKT
jgi:hypothetical protein